MIPRTTWYWLIGCCLLCFFATGTMWWGGSYQEYNRSDFRWGTVPILAGAALFLSWIIGAGILPSGFMVSCVFPAVVMTRVVLDGLENPTNHNLWPFEIAVASAMGMAMAFPPAVVGGVLRRFTHRSTPPAPLSLRTEL
jgi:hypothetical protein